MKIIYIGTAHPFRGGLASFNERLAEEFQRLNHETIVYTFTKQYPKFLFPGKSQYSTQPAPINLNIVRLIHSYNPFNWLKSARIIANQNSDLIVLKFWLPYMGACFGFILRWVKHFNKNCKIVCIVDNLLPHEKRVGDRLLIKYFSKPIDLFITMSTTVTQQCKDFPLKKRWVETVHPLYDNFGNKQSREEARKSLKLPNDKKIVLFFGFIRKYKGLDLFLQMITDFQRLSKLDENRMPIFLVAGEFYDKKENYSPFISEALKTNCLIMHDFFIDDHKVRDYFCAANVVICPYKNATQSGIIPLAYHFDLPLIVTNVGSLAEYVPNDKIGLVAKPEVKDLSKKLHEYFTLNEDDFVKNFAQEKVKYSWLNLANTILTEANR